MWHVWNTFQIWKTNQRTETIKTKRTLIIAVPNFKSFDANITESFGPLMMYPFIFGISKTAIKMFEKKI
jgi:hypothetical protein